ncbi:hypothetical protein F4553_000965 [Allocatelliglobosispora scoriae]|uniref:Uncharacterized protein n=1 Tax=Allocatelliglobosispora scoriae TaxID=643052 RepID=A0A841BK41_9ACTN|nr:hypothetical protein [Allocatelliglobosispora scoriae]MBB5867586.1 hypothetical protein [Allocatelliglobosispora scoriae]
MRRTTKLDQWSQELQRARDPQELFGASAHHGTVRLLTMSGKIPFRSAVDGMTPREQSVIRHLLGRDEITLTPVDSPGLAACDVLLAHSALGKLTLHEPALGDHPDSEVVAGLALPDWLREMVDEEDRAARAAEDNERRQLEELLTGWVADGSLARRLEEVIDWVERVETVLVYIGRRIFSRSDSGSSTLIRDAVLPALRDRDPADWAPEERLFVAAIQLLFRTGRAVRFEEFNGRQLSAVGLRQVLLGRCAAYRTSLGAAPATDLSTATLAELAAIAGDLVPLVDGGDAMRYRRVNGLTYAKDEFLLPWPQHDRVLAEPAPAMLALASARRWDDGAADDAATWVRRMTGHALRSAADGLGVDDLQDVLQSIVLAAVVAGKADYGMSSGVRDLARLAQEAEGFGEGMQALKKPDFFCCVLPSAAMAEDLPEEEVTDILWQVAQRMMYNRWHFVPGNFDRAEVPRNRHYFFPPLVPDIGEWADLRHGGHSTARVRFTLRAPGAAMWLPPLSVGGKNYRGAYDIRLVRMDGPPFTVDDMRTASRFSALVDIFWREIAAHTDAHGGHAPVFTGFTAEWYAKTAWLDTVRSLGGGQ